MSANQLDLRCLFSPDVPKWEKLSIEAVLEALGEGYHVGVSEISQSEHRYFHSKSDAKATWIVARDWRQILHFLSIGKANGKVFLSAFGRMAPDALPFLFWKSLQAKIPQNTQLLTHSPLAYRFFEEIAGVPKKQIHHLHLPLSQQIVQQSKKRGKVLSENPFDLKVGTVAYFDSEAHLNYLLNVAHSVIRKRPETQFHVFGSGPLSEHLKRSIEDLGLHYNVEIKDADDLEAICELDLLLYVPIRNYHFGGILKAAAAKIPVISSHIPGVEEFISEGKNGYIFPVNETEAMAEKVVAMLRDSTLRLAMGEQLYQDLIQKFNSSSVAEGFSHTFFEQSLPRVQRAA